MIKRKRKLSSFSKFSKLIKLKTSDFSYIDTIWGIYYSTVDSSIVFCYLLLHLVWVLVLKLLL